MEKYFIMNWGFRINDEYPLISSMELENNCFVESIVAGRNELIRAQDLFNHTVPTFEFNIDNELSGAYVGILIKIAEYGWSIKMYTTELDFSAESLLYVNDDYYEYHPEADDFVEALNNLLDILDEMGIDYAWQAGLDYDIGINKVEVLLSE